MSRLLLIRHGATRGNLEKRYVGSTDEGLLPESAGALRERYKRWLNVRQSGEPNSGAGEFDPEAVYISPMRRCRETAAVLFPGKEYRVIEAFRECGFGDFEYRNYDELNGNPAYQRFIDSGGESAFPGGESKQDFTDRVCRAFTELEIRGDAALVVHGGTIMALLDRFSSPHRGYYEWQLPCGAFFETEWDGISVHLVRRVD